MQTLKRTNTEARLFSVEDYRRMGRAEIFADDERTELVEGVIYSMHPAGPSHAAVVHFVFLYLLEVLDPSQAAVRMEQSLAVDEYNEPVPDVMVVNPDPHGYFDAHPTPADVQLVIEVADSSLSRDLKVKNRLYASAGIQHYWVVDTQSRRLVIFEQPDAEGYTSESEYLYDAPVVTIGGVPIEIRRFFPPPEP